MKLFISHSQQDRPFILPMVEMLYSIGMSENDIFCSSIPEPGIPGRKEIYEYLRELFVKEELYVLFMLSDRYYQSPNCLNEMGAAWIVKSKYTTFLLPGFTFAEMEGAVDPRKISIKLDDEEDIVRYTKEWPHNFVKLPFDHRIFLNKFSSNHCHAVYGNCREELIMICKMLRMDYEVLGE